jgi:oxygen-independent coproporphyrinogen-3 oxidase
MKTQGLYLHIPFCEQKCHYCDFVIRVNGDDEHADFLAALEIQAQYMAKVIENKNFSTVYLGGGTPSMLSGDEMKRVFDILNKHYIWAKDSEITCEVNPSDVTAEKIKTYRDLGINRISLGAQSFSDLLLKDMGRTHQAKDIQKAFEIIQAAGINNISLDLMIRLPQQTLLDVELALQACLKMDVGQIVVYDLTIHDKTVYGHRLKQNSLKLPSENTHSEMMDLIQETLIHQSNYRHYELLSYAKPGFESKHNMIYWKNGYYLGLGPGAFSYQKNKRFMFAKNYSSYIKKCNQGDWQNDSEDVLTPIEVEMETFLVGLRLEQGIDISPLVILQNHLNKALPKLISSGLIQREGQNISLTKRGKYLAETVFSELSL